MTPTPTPTSADVIEGMREALGKIERGITAVRLDAALNEQPISPDVLKRIHEDILAALALPDPKPDNQGGA